MVPEQRDGREQRLLTPPVGIDEPGTTREKAVEIREAEQREAAGIAGAT